MNTLPVTPPTAATTLRVHSVSADEGLIWALTDGRGRLVGSAAAALRETISAVDVPTAEVEIWVAPGDAAAARWNALVPALLAGLHLLEVERVEAHADADNEERLALLASSGFRVTGVDRDGTLRLTADLAAELTA